VVNVGIVRYDFKVIVENIGTNDLSNILLFVTIYNQNHESISYGDTGEVISYIASGRSTEHSFQRMINASELSNSPYLFIRAYGGTGNNDERTLMLF